MVLLLLQPHPVDNLATIFTARRDLLRPLQEQVVTPESGLTLEEADVLVLLNEAMDQKQAELSCDEEDYVPFSELQDALVHSTALLSHRLRKLQDRELVEVTRLRHRKNLSLSARQARHGNSVYVRITAKGRRKVFPVWQRYQKLAEELLCDLPPEIRRAHLQLNEHLANKLRPAKGASAHITSSPDTKGVTRARATPSASRPPSPRERTPSAKRDSIMQNIIDKVLWNESIRADFDRTIAEKLKQINLPVQSIHHERNPVVILKLAVPPAWRPNPEIVERRIRMTFAQAGYPVPNQNLFLVLPGASGVRVYARPYWLDKELAQFMEQAPDPAPV